MPELPSAKRERYLALGLPMYDVLILAGDVSTAQLFDACVAEGVTPKTASNWIMGDISAYCNVSAVPGAAFSPSLLPPHVPPLPRTLLLNAH